MEIAKEKWFEVRYNTRLDKLVIKKERLRNRFLKTIKKHKLITVASMAFVMFSILNTYMIYSFMKILQNI